MLRDIKKTIRPRRTKAPKPSARRARLSVSQVRFDGISVGGAVSILAGPQSAALRRPGFNVQKALVRGFQLTAVTLAIMIVTLPFFQAFEAHVINVTGEVAQIDPPVLTIPGDIGWDNLNGGTGLEGEVEVVMTDDDPDATHIFFTFGPGLDPGTIADPVCGDVFGGEIATEIIALSLAQDTVIKAIACDGDDSGAHHSVINTKIYDFGDGPPFLCEPFAVSFPTDLAVLAAGTPTSSLGDILAAANVEINGDVHSNDDINASGGGSNRNINGNATAGGAIATANFNISGTVATSSPTTTLPDINIPLWQDLADDGGTVNGSLIFPNNTTGIELGPTEILGDLDFGQSNEATINGPIYVHGDIIIRQNTVITQNSAFGNQFVTIIADGVIDIRSNVAFVGAGTLGTFLLVSTSGPISGADAAIHTSSNNSDLGDVVLYAQNGDVHIRSNRTLLAIFAFQGTSGTAPAIDLDSNVTVNYRELPTAISCGPAFTPIESVLINEFLPNPIGSDVGEAGPPLNGEWVELYNGTVAPVDVNGWFLYDDDDTHALEITTANVAGGDTTIPAGGFLVVYRDGDSDFSLNNSGGDSVRLYDAAIGSGGSLVDSHIYTTSAPEDKSFARIPDGTANWVDPEPSPGEPNKEFFVPLGEVVPEQEEVQPELSFADSGPEPEQQEEEKSDETPTSTATTTIDVIAQPEEDIEEPDGEELEAAEEIVEDVSDMVTDEPDEAPAAQEVNLENEEAVLPQNPEEPEDVPDDSGDSGGSEPETAEGVFGETLLSDSVDAAQEGGD